MTSFDNQKFDNRVIDVNSIMEAEQNQEEDPFLGSIEYARSMLLPDEESCGSNGRREETSGRGLNWIASRILKTCIAYSSRVTSAILLSQLSQAWNEQHRAGAPRKRPECINQLKKTKKEELPKTLNSSPRPSFFVSMW